MAGSRSDMADESGRDVCAARAAAGDRQPSDTPNALFFNRLSRET
jgi:hypothetical protein